ncbi:hypothetical protein HDV01_001036 [Terramyces sp. JEL0728]|nr:hypothetical protein HDV01_001036 [Terramyces sp. JEL0728]
MSCDALAKVYPSFGSPTSLAESGDCCTWSWIGCDDNKNIKKIALNGKNLQGTIPNSISTLAGLKSLILNNNALTGQLPASLGQIGLQILYLNDNMLTGPLVSLNGASLVYLDLKDNFITGDIPGSVNVAAGNLSDGNKGCSFDTYMCPTATSIPNCSGVKFCQALPTTTLAVPSATQTFSTSSTPTAPTDSSSNGISTGAIVGIACAVAVVIGIAIAAVLWYFKKDEIAPLISDAGSQKKAKSDQVSNYSTPFGKPSQPYDTQSNTRSEQQSATSAQPLQLKYDTNSKRSSLIFPQTPLVNTGINLPIVTNSIGRTGLDKLHESLATSSTRGSPKLANDVPELALSTVPENYFVNISPPVQPTLVYSTAALPISPSSTYLPSVPVLTQIPQLSMSYPGIVNTSIHLSENNQTTTPAVVMPTARFTSSPTVDQAVPVVAPQTAEQLPDIGSPSISEAQPPMLNLGLLSAKPSVQETREQEYQPPIIPLSHIEQLENK